MSIIAENSGSDFDRTLPPAGNHIARCVSMIHLGTLETEYMGVKKVQDKVRISFELPLALHVFQEEKGEQPFMVTKEYTLSMYEKGNLRADLESWRGKTFTDDESKSFDITAVLGAPCMVNVIIKTSKNNKEYAHIQGITPIPKGLGSPERINDLFEFSVNEWNQTKFDGIADWIKKMIMESAQYKEMMNPTAKVEPHQTQTEAKAFTGEPSESDAIDDEEPPF